MPRFTVELVIKTTKASKNVLYVSRFFISRKVWLRLHLPSSPKSKEIRALFDEKDDDKVYPILVVMQDEEVIWKAKQPREKGLYDAFHLYFQKKDESG